MSATNHLALGALAWVWAWTPAACCTETKDDSALVAQTLHDIPARDFRDEPDSIHNNVDGPLPGHAAEIVAIQTFRPRMSIRFTNGTKSFCARSDFNKLVSRTLQDCYQRPTTVTEAVIAADWEKDDLGFTLGTQNDRIRSCFEHRSFTLPPPNASFGHCELSVVIDPTGNMPWSEP